MNVLIAGQKYFGYLVLKEMLNISGVNIVCVSSPTGKKDRLTDAAVLNETPVIPSGSLNVATMPEKIDLIIAAHSHDFIGEKTRLRATYGGIGYHPSLLPIHRGRDAIKWALKMRERVTGGTVYRLSNKMDGGNILAQEHVFIKPNDTDKSLWEETLQPLGVELLKDVVLKIKEHGHILGVEQDERIATFEPSMSPPPCFRPDLILIGGCNG